MRFWAPGALLMLLTPLVGGAALVRALCGCRGMRAVSLGFPAAMGAMAMLFMVTYLAGLPTLGWWALELVLGVLSILLARRNGVFQRDQNPALEPCASAPLAGLWTGRTVVAALVLVAAAAAVVQGANGLLNPHGNWDAYAIWNLHARFIFRDPARGLLYLGGNMEWTHPEYPLLLPCLVARGWTLNGGESQLVPWLLGVVQLLSVAVLLYWQLGFKRGGSKLESRLSLLALLGTPMVLHSTSSQYADMVLACFVLVAATAFMNWLETEEPRWLALAGAAAGFGACTKLEGYMLVAALTVTCLVVALTRRTRRPVLPALTWLVSGLGPGLGAELLFRLTASSRLPAKPEFGLTQVLTRLSQPGRYLTTGSRLAAEPLNLRQWSMVPMLVLVYPLASGLARGRRRGAAAGTYGLLLLVLALYFGIYIAMPGDLDWYLNMSLDRLMLHCFPTFILASLSLGGRAFSAAGCPADEPNR